MRKLWRLSRDAEIRFGLGLMSHVVQVTPLYFHEQDAKGYIAPLLTVRTDVASCTFWVPAALRPLARAIIYCFAAAEVAVLELRQGTASS
jgi:hypothetical protein